MYSTYLLYSLKYLFIKICLSYYCALFSFILSSIFNHPANSEILSTLYVLLEVQVNIICLFRLHSVQYYFW